MPARLTERNGTWHFVRKVPQEFAHLDRRGVIKLSTKIRVGDDRAGAKASRIAAQFNLDLEASWRAKAGRQAYHHHTHGRRPHTQQCTADRTRSASEGTSCPQPAAGAKRAASSSSVLGQDVGEGAKPRSPSKLSADDHPVESWLSGAVVEALSGTVFRVRRTVPERIEMARKSGRPQCRKID